MRNNTFDNQKQDMRTDAFEQIRIRCNRCKELKMRSQYDKDQSNLVED